MAEGGMENSILALHITNFPPLAAQEEQFEMYLENKTDQDDFHVEYNHSYDEALVKFTKLTLEPLEVITRIRQEPLLGTNLTVNEVQFGNRILATNLIKPNAGQELLELYFESSKLNPSEKSVQVEFDSSCHAAIVTFSDASVIEHVLAADHSKVLGPDAVVRRCEYFESLADFALEDFNSETLSNAGSTLADDQVLDENSSVNGEAGSVSGETSSRGRGRRGRRWINRGGPRRGYRGTRGGPVTTPREHRSSVSSVTSEGFHEDRDGAGDRGSRGNRGYGRGRRTGGTGGHMPHSFGERPGSSQGRYEEQEDGSSADRGHRRGGHHHFVRTDGGNYHSNENRGNQRGNRHPSGGTGPGRGRNWGQNHRAGSVPNLLDQPLLIPPGSAHKEIDVSNEIRNEKCRLLMTMMFEIKSHNRCNARIDVPRHRVILDGTEAAVSSATEDVYSRLCNMHSVRLDLPPALARKLDTSDGRNQMTEFFKQAKMRAIYYTDVDNLPMIIAGDEYAAVSYAAQLMGKIDDKEIPYNDHHRSYLSSEDWINFVSAAQKMWFLAIELTPRNSISVVGISDDVEVAAANIQSQLAEIGVDRTSRNRPGSATGKARHHRRADVSKESRRSRDAQEPSSEACPICGISFPLNAIADHAEQCAENRLESRVCPVCYESFQNSSSSSAVDFQQHVNSHFF